LKDSYILKEVIAEKVDALLYGHNHQGKARNGGWSIGRCYDAGSATKKPRPKVISWLPLFEVKARTRMVRLDETEATKDYVLELL
jgi:hypothetical protein